MTVAVYRSTDANAPVLAGDSRVRVVNLLNKCLVTGYGDKTPAGWTMPFVNAETTRASFRSNPSAGTGFYLDVDCATPGNTSIVNLCGYEAMTGVGTGLFPFGAVTGIYVSENTSATARPWVLFATETWFYFFSWRGETVVPNAARMLVATQVTAGLNMFFGDIESLYATDPYRVFLSVGTESSTANGFGSVRGYGAPEGLQRMARAISGVAGGSAAGISLSPPGRHANSGGWCSAGLPYTAQTGAFACKAMIFNGVEYAYRGWLPGLFAVCHNNLVFEQLEEVSFNGGTYLHVIWKISSYGVGGTSYLAAALIGPVG